MRGGGAAAGRPGDAVFAHLVLPRGEGRWLGVGSFGWEFLLAFLVVKRSVGVA